MLHKNNEGPLRFQLKSGSVLAFTDVSVFL